MSVDLQEAGYRAHVVVNCKMDTDGIREDVQNSQSAEKTKLRIYNPLTEKKGHRIRRGEILWTFREYNAVRPNPHQQPFVRAALNGALIKRDTSLGINGMFNSSVPCTVKKVAMRQFMRKIRPVGLSNKDIDFDGVIGNDPKDHPVATISGLMTTRNTGTDFIQAGQLIVAALPDPFSTQMLSAADNPGGNKFPRGGTVPQETIYIKDRKVLATKPLHSVSFVIPFSLMKFCKAISNLYDETLEDIQELPKVAATIAGEKLKEDDVDGRKAIARKALLESLATNKTEEDDAEKTKTPMGVMFDSFQEYGPIAGASKSIFLSGKLESSGILEEEREIIETMMLKHKGFKEAYELFLMTIRAEINDQLSNVIGVATTDARPGFNFDIMVLPPPTF